MLLESILIEVLILKGLTAAFGLAAMARSRLRSPLRKADATDSHKKENAATWLPQQRLHLVVPKMIIAKFGLGSRKKREGEKVPQSRRVR